MPTQQRPDDDGSIADLTPEGVPTEFSIGVIAEQTGISESVLRIWEQRYGWPKPKRQANGYRTYRSDLIPLLRAIQAEIARGQTIGALLRDPTWSAIMDAGRLPVESSRAKPRPDWAMIPQPGSDEARRLREQLEQALERGDRGAITHIEAQAGRLRPQDRERAITAVLRYWQDLTGSQS